MALVIEDIRAADARRGGRWTQDGPPSCFDDAFTCAFINRYDISNHTRPGDHRCAVRLSQDVPLRAPPVVRLPRQPP